MFKTKRFNINDNFDKRFYRVPDALFSEPYRNLSNDARILYAILLSRTELSKKNAKIALKRNQHRWMDDQGNLYIVCPLKELQSRLGFSTSKASRILHQLVDADLIEIIKQGQGKANLIYIGIPTDGNMVPENGKDNPISGKPASQKWEAGIAGTGRSYTDESNTTRTYTEGDIITHGEFPCAATTIPPDIQSVTRYCEQRKSNVQPQEFINYYNFRGWKGVSNWQTKICQWEHRQHERTRQKNNYVQNILDDVLKNCKEDSIYEIHMDRT